MIKRLRCLIPAGAQGEISSPQLILCADSYSVSVPHSVTAVARKRPRSLYQICRWQVTPKNAYNLDPTESEWAEYAAIHALSGDLFENELTRNLSGNARPKSPQLAEPLWTDPGLKSRISVCELISTLKKKKKAHAGNKWLSILPKSSLVRKKRVLVYPPAQGPYMYA